MATVVIGPARERKEDGDCLVRRDKERRRW